MSRVADAYLKRKPKAVDEASKPADPPPLGAVVHEVSEPWDLSGREERRTSLAPASSLAAVRTDRLGVGSGTASLPARTETAPSRAESLTTLGLTEPVSALEEDDEQHGIEGLLYTLAIAKNTSTLPNPDDRRSARRNTGLFVFALAAALLAVILWLSFFRNASEAPRPAVSSAVTSRPTYFAANQ